MTYLRIRLETGKSYAGYEVCHGLAALAYFRRDMAEFFERYDLPITPTNTCPAFIIGQRPPNFTPAMLKRISHKIDVKKLDFDTANSALVQAFNLTGQPAASIPCGFSSDGLPIGLQIVGRWGDEATVLRASAAFEEAQPWSNHIPPVAQ